MIQEMTFAPSGRMNRRDPIDELPQGDVRVRENFLVIGTGEAKQNRKMSGSDRYTLIEGTGRYTWGARYYSGVERRTFAFRDGKLWHVAEDGTVTERLAGLNINSYPSSEIVKVNGTNVMMFVDGQNGMFSYDGNPGFVWAKETAVELNFVSIISHLDRLWGFEENSDNLYFSKTLQPTNFTDVEDAGVISIGPKRGSKMQQFAILNETLYIWKEDAIYVLEGRTIADFRVREVHPTLGTPARNSVVTTKTGSIMFLGSDYEVHAFTGSQESTKSLSYNMCLGGDMTNNLLTLINQTKVTSCYAVFHLDLYRLAFTESGQTTNNMEYIFNTTNLTDGLTRGNNVSCYFVYDKEPDKRQLITGRSDAGLLMYQYRGYNYDNQAVSPTMSYRLLMCQKTGIRNARFKRIWANINVLGANNINVKTTLDTRLAASDQTTTPMATQGEVKQMTNFLRINNQASITSRAVLPWSNSKGQTLSIEINDNQKDINLNLSSFVVEAIVKEVKRSKKVGI